MPIACVRNQVLVPSDESGTSCNMEQHRDQEPTLNRRHQMSTSGQIKIPTSDPQILRSVVELEQRAMSQIKALRAFKSSALVSEPTRSLLDEIDAHQVGMQRTMATAINLWCRDGSIAERLKGNLKTNLQKSIEESNDLKHVLATTTNRGVPVIYAERPSKNSHRTRCTF